MMTWAARANAHAQHAEHVVRGLMRGIDQAPTARVFDRHSLHSVAAITYAGICTSRMRDSSPTHSHLRQSWRGLGRRYPCSDGAGDRKGQNVDHICWPGPEPANDLRLKFKARTLILLSFSTSNLLDTPWNRGAICNTLKTSGERITCYLFAVNQ